MDAIYFIAKTKHLSRTLTSAGGIGGMLAEQSHETDRYVVNSTVSAWFPAYDPGKSFDKIKTDLKNAKASQELHSGIEKILWKQCYES